MNRLIDDQGRITLGIFPHPLKEINYRDYLLTTPMGSRYHPSSEIYGSTSLSFGITGPDVIAGLAVVNLKYLASGFLYVYDLKSDTIIEAGKTALPVGSKKFITSNPANVSCGFTSGALSINIESQRISARSKGMDIDLTFDRAGTAPLRICTKAGYSGWVYTEKSSPITISGRITTEDRQIEIASPSHMGLMDWTAGYMRRETFWNWAASAWTLRTDAALA
ncbi:MAG: DUF2804 family protein [Desulfobacterales bacterium]